MSELWAKSKTKDGRQLSLVQHTTDVIDAGELLFGKPSARTPLGERWLPFFKLDVSLFDRFARTLCVAAGFHDLGKANDGFFDAVTRNGKQVIRHEHLSALLMFHPPVWKWLSQHEGIDWEIALSAVLTHHLKAPQCDTITPQTMGLDHVQLCFGETFNELLQTIRRRVGLEGAWPALPRYWTFARSGPGENIRSHVVQLKAALEEFDEHCGDGRRRLLWAVRAGLIAADGAASGLFRAGESMAEWINERFQREKPCDSSYVKEHVIDNRVKQLGRRWCGWHQFQDAAARQPARTLLLAPCGSGKTLAAWRWIEEQTRLRPVQRIIFLYPTRATATEGFKDYVAWAPEADASLITGSAAYELEGMFANPSDPSDDRKGKSFGVDPRLFALGYWCKRIFAGTVDQFLAFLQYSYGPMCLLPVLTDSVVVIDEVHSFDDKMFSALKRFLDHFDLPVLCMTATLPQMRRRELRSCGLTEYAEKPDDLQQIADAPRYAIKRLDSRAQAEEVVAEALGSKRRVLWVVNKVRTAQELAKKFGTAQTPQGLHMSNMIPVLCYHSRFTLNDRKRWHQSVVAAFQRKEGEPPQAVLAITTQVCEMSLDLDADVLITEEAPITALIQRMGRCNRKSEVPKGLGSVYVYPPDDPKRPYPPDDLAGVKAFLEELCRHATASQSQLEAALEKHGQKPPQGDRLIQFIVSGPYADGGEDEFRDIDDFASTGILDEAEYLNAAPVERPGLIVPVPKHLEGQRGADKKTRHLSIAKQGHYHPALGLCDEPMGG